ncbi:MAG: glycosyltransferase [Candidatus Methanomethyliaceae archaeon]
MPRVSVIIPSYNHAHFISEAIQSVLNQTEKDLELIVVDDGSTDESWSILNRISDTRFRAIFQEHQGAHAALNRGLQEAQGVYLAILNSDDAYYPQRLKLLAQVLESRRDLGLIGSFIEVIDSRGQTLGVKHGYKDLEPWILSHPDRGFRFSDDQRGALLTENFFATTSNFVFKRGLYEQIGGFRELRYAHDWDFLLRASLVSLVEVFPEVLLRYRVHSKNTIRQDMVGMVFEICWCLAVHLPFHVDDILWFGKAPLYQRVEQLLYSIYTFGCQEVLIVMLLQRLWENPSQALELLKPGNLVREKYLNFIRERLSQNERKERSKKISLRQMANEVIRILGW